MTKRWSSAAGQLNYSSREATWTRLPGEAILTVDVMSTQELRDT
jgi:hypothetical protein